MLNFTHPPGKPLPVENFFGRFRRECGVCLTDQEVPKAIYVPGD